MRHDRHVQHTISQTVSISGIGLHSGLPAVLKLSPAPSHTGLVFRQHGVPGVRSCRASIHHWVDKELCTALEVEGIQFHTIEHLLAALSGLAVDNVYIDLDTQEIPALDGSAAPFVDLIRSAGITPQVETRPYLKITKPLKVCRGNSWITVTPSSRFRVTASIQYDHHLIQTQMYDYQWPGVDFSREVAPARTFALSEDIEAIWAKGLGQGGSLDNTVVLSPSKVLNERGLRFPDECVRHKVLDIIGDLALIGKPLLGHVSAFRSGHALHGELVKTLVSQAEGWVLTDVDGKPVEESCQAAEPGIICSGSLDSSAVVRTDFSHPAR